MVWGWSGKVLARFADILEGFHGRKKVFISEEMHGENLSGQLSLQKTKKNVAGTEN